MGLKYAAQAFQRLMDSVCAGLEFVFVYLDDILVASESEEQHVKHLTMLFDRLEENGLVVKVKKCLLGVSEIDFLGHKVSKGGILPLPTTERTCWKTMSGSNNGPRGRQNSGSCTELPQASKVCVCQT